jgi:hypothetical protein
MATMTGTTTSLPRCEGSAGDQDANKPAAVGEIDMNMAEIGYWSYFRRRWKRRKVGCKGGRYAKGHAPHAADHRTPQPEFP